jgi:hypothetical protein
MQPHSPYQQPYQPPAKKKGNGCLVALGIFAGILVLGAIAAGIGIYVFSQSDEGKHAFGIMKEGIKAAQEGANAPGTPELRELGCQQAIVLDMNKLMKHFDAGQAKSDEPLLMVTCQATATGTPPTCDDVARTYVKAMGGHAESPIAVVVQVPFKPGKQCRRYYSEDGTFIREIKDKEP